MEVQLQSGTLVASTQTNGVSQIRGLIGVDRVVAIRWQGKVTEVARKSLITADTTAEALLTPTVIKFTTHFRFDFLQGNAARLTFALPATHALTRLVGEQIRDWQLNTEGDRQVLTVEFIKPVEKACTLTLHSEQALENSTAAVRLDPPQPLDIERESGAFSVSAEDHCVLSTIMLKLKTHRLLPSRSKRATDPLGLMSWTAVPPSVTPCTFGRSSQISSAMARGPA